jgi:hypothetical protein
MVGALKHALRERHYVVEVLRSRLWPGQTNTVKMTWKPKHKLPASDKQKKPRSNAESVKQQGFIEKFKLIYSDLWAQKRLHAIPNGAYRSQTVAKISKAEGQVAGVWDLFLSIPKGKYGGLWIETKVGRNDLTDEQKIFMLSHKEQYHFAICRTEFEFLKTIEEYLALPEYQPPAYKEEHRRRIIFNQ